MHPTGPVHITLLKAAVRLDVDLVGPHPTRASTLAECLAPPIIPLRLTILHHPPLLGDILSLLLRCSVTLFDVITTVNNALQVNTLPSR